MTSTVARFALILAGMGVSRAEAKRMLMEIQTAPIEDFMQCFTHFSEASVDWKSHRHHSDALPSARGQAARDGSVGDRVERLLKHEAGLSAGAASDMLSEMLVAAGLIHRDEIPPLSRKALRIWVDRILRRVPAKDILRFATLIRNQYVHDVNTDWTLGRR